MSKQRTYINKLPEHIGQSVVLKGFVQAIRNQGGIKFLILRDVTGLVQLVVLKSSAAFEKVSGLTLESVIEVIGTVKEEKQAPGGIEVAADDFVVLGEAAPELPIPVVVEKGGEETEVSKRLDWRFIDLRKPEKAQIFRIWTELERGVRDFFYSRGFTQIYTPSFMDAPSESGAEVFEVAYFEKKAYLAQSPQFYKQMAMAAGLEKVFTMGPVYRAEPSFTTRHMTEFTGWDFEISYIESHFDVMAELEQMLLAGFERVKTTVLPDLKVPTVPFPKLTMLEAKAKLAARNVPSEKPSDLSPEEERALYDISKEDYNSDFIFVTDYPVEVRPFYHMRYEDNPGITKSFDLLYKGIEIVTGAQREHRLDILEKQALEKGMPLESISSYLSFFKYGCPPHGGVGIGPGRIVMKMLDLPSVKEATYLPRDVKRLSP